MTIELSRLRSVPPREIWPHEALDFTPWLLANVDVLSDLLGMELSLEAAEHPVGGFYLDLLGTDLATGERVIVENQLATSDHSHLGQLLTYAAGTDPTTIVWITTNFRSEHRAAIEWLNDHTDETIRFFGVEIEVVRIGDSAAAPAFKMAIQPNDWGKRVRAATSPSALASGANGKAALYWDFWDRLRTKVQLEHPGWSRARTSTQASWFNMSLGKTGVVVSLSFSRAGLCVQVYFESPDAQENKARFDAFAAKRPEFESAAGQPLVWDRMEGAKAARISLMSTYSDVADQPRWQEMIDWLIDAQLRLRRAIDAVGGIPDVRAVVS